MTAAGGRTYFVTGTDTDVGKTVATVWLASALAPGHRVALVKPVQTGASDPAVDGDEGFYRRALGPLAARVTLTTLESLPEPLAPSIAAARAGRRVDVDALVARCRAIAAAHDLTLVEGAGGLLVTLDETPGGGMDMAGLAAALDAPLVVVIRPALGTLNHTLLTVEAAQRRGLPVELLICSGYPDAPGPVEQENLRFLRRRYPRLPLLVLGHAALDAGEGLEALRPWLLGEPPALLRGLSLPDAPPGGPAG